MRTGQLPHFRLTPALDVLFEFRSEFLDRIFHRPTSAVGEAADRRARHDADAVADLVEQIQVFKPTLTLADAIDDLEHPAGALSAGRALAARLVGIEPAGVVEHIDH